jgi:alkanesulfonate monooxygenase SsuD/methylene tetrahydromethanopterin reductase-like flavin-dependent oxidoreductase (luciferase family)
MFLAAPKGEPNTCPEHAILKWLDHTKAIAAEFYLQVTDDDFRRATGREAVQGPVQQAAAGNRTGLQGDQNEDQQTVFCGSPQRCADACDSFAGKEMGDTGLEPVTPCL